MTAPALVSTPFTGSATAAEIVAGVDLSGQRIVVTGAASGIGRETARVLAGAGAEITLAVRDAGAGRNAADEIRASVPRAQLHVAALDLADLASVSAFVHGWRGPLHVLVCNAGVMATPETRTPDGWELQLATNHLGHFALARGLHHALLAADGARVVSVASSAHLRSPVIFDDLHFNFRKYDPAAAYAQSKTANVLFAVAAFERWRGDGITANALHPGAIATNLQRHTGGMQTPVDRRKSVAQGAATSVLLAASPLVAGVGGRYFDDCNECPVVERYDGTSTHAVAPYALDRANADRLWMLSERMIDGAMRR